MNGDRVGSIGDVAARIAATAAGIGFLGVVAAVPVGLATGGIRVGSGATTVHLDALALILSAMVLGLSSLIQSFAVRYLRGDPRQVWFVAAANLLTGFTVLMVCAGSVAVFAVAWLGAGVALVLLLATYWPLAQAQDGVRRTAIRLLIADAAFLLGVVVLLVAAGGDVSLDGIGELTSAMSLPAQLAIALLLVTAALARSSQLPFQGWLPFTLAAPTPVSALMHAGVVNAGAILLIRFAPVIAPHQSVMITVFLVGAATLVYASAVRLVRADVKGRLVFSTMAQMGFMIMACGLGLFATAIFHLVAHSLFKSTLFLGAGMGVREHGVDRDLPTRQPRSRLTAAAAVGVAIIVPASALLGAKLTLSPTVTASSVGLLVFVSLTATVALASALTSNFSLRTVAAGIAATVGLAFGYVAFLNIFTATLEPIIAIDAAPAWLFVVPGLGLLVVQLLAHNPRQFAWLRDPIYARLLITIVGRPPSAKGVLA